MVVLTTKEILWPGNKRDTDCFVLSVGKKYKSLGQCKTSGFVFFRTDAQNSQYPVIINWQPSLKGLIRKYANMIGLISLPPGVVQSGINIAYIATIMVAK